jgi:hypothetical protein
MLREEDLTIDWTRLKEGMEKCGEDEGGRR